MTDNDLIARESPVDHQLRALVVDDHRVMRIMVREILEQSGIEVCDAEHGDEALEMLDKQAFDLILLDVMMPVRDGFDTCAAIRARADGQFVPIVMMTGLDDAKSIHRAFEAGATDFISKPLNVVILTYRIKYLLRASAMANELRESEARLEHAQHLAKIGHWRWSAKTGHFTCSQLVENILGVKSGTITKNNEPFLQRLHPDDRDLLSENMRSALITGKQFNTDYRVIADDGSVLYVTQKTAVAGSFETDNLFFSGAIQDVTERREAEEKAHKLTFFDALTGLPNRISIQKFLQRILAEAKRYNRTVAVLSLDIDHFKRINDTVGHESGNLLLKSIGERLVQTLRAGDVVGNDHPTKSERVLTVARVGGDEFVVVLSEIAKPIEAASVARRIQTALAAPIITEDNEFFVTASIGISVYPLDGDLPDVLLNHADAALNHAKSEGRNCYQFYTESINARASERLSLENRLREGIQKGHFELVYQPKISFVDRRTVGAEALVRWNDPETGFIAPDDFIPLAEETGLIIELGDWIIEEACASARRWLDAGVPTMHIAVNISPAQFRAPDLEAKIRSAVKRHRLKPEVIEIEITENLLMDDIEETIGTLENLRRAGFNIWIDDFGTGYSSLSYLKRFPITGVKIDQSFVRDMHKNSDDRAIVSAIAGLAKNLGLSIVAEGVETDIHFNLLAQHGCDFAQGYYISRPLPEDDFLAWVRAQQTTPDPVAV